MKILGIIPARGGSKQIKKKNLKKIAGKPLIYYTIEAALNSKYLTDIIISTDDSEISEFSKKLGIIVDHVRPKYLSEDQSSTWSVVNYEMRRLEENGKRYDFAMMLQPTTPFRDTALIDKICLKSIQYKDIDSIVSIVNVGANHPHRMYKKDINNKLKPLFKNIKDPMLARQLLPPVYIRSGDVYLTKRECIFEKKSLIGNNSIGVEIPSEYAINIDTEYDLIIANHIMKKKMKKK